MIYSFYLSLCDYGMGPTRFIGVGNYQRMLLADPLFWKSLYNTLIYTVVAVPLGLTGSLLLAVLLNKRIKARGILRTIFYIPTLVPLAASSYVWMYLLQKNFGLLNVVLRRVGIHGPDWLQHSAWAMPSIILMSLWGIGGVRMIIFLAGLQDVPPSLYESASIDGASKLRQFWHVTIPMLTPVIFFNLILGIIGAFQLFTQVFLMTNGGPDNATLVYALYMFHQAFVQMHMGYASALAWVLFIILAGITAAQFIASRKWVHYEGELA